MEKKSKQSTIFISQGQDSKPAGIDPCFSSQIIYDQCDGIFIPVNESAKGFPGLELSLMI